MIPLMKLKICMLGAFAVGKTSLVRRFVTSIFSDKYLTTVGVKIDKKTVNVEGSDLDLLIWDLQGEDSIRETPAAYLRGSAGYLLVVDGTRAQTLEVAQTIHERVGGVLGAVPAVLLLNKVDLAEDWELDDGTIAELTDNYRAVYRTSAKNGEGVEEAFQTLAKAVATGPSSG